VKNEGFRAFWKGNLSATYLYAVYGSSQFYALSLLRPLFASNTNDILVEGLAGGYG
jgi:hypothetical protein